ncbi:MAG TPA: accessory factor UbiK family protein [Cellvibrio sp.]|nr:accessory factor UbiK family protein [Cellvibrio sp.]
MIRDLTERLVAELQQFGSDGLKPSRELNLALQAVLSRLDLVTREEFDAQAAVLARTRQKLEELEHTLAQLEQ